MEEKLNSIIITINFVIGLIIPMGIVNNLYLILFLLFLNLLTYKCSLLLINHKFRYTIILLILSLLLGIIRGYIFSDKYIGSLGLSEEYMGEAEIITVVKEEKYIISLKKKPFCKVLLSTKDKLKPGMIIDLKGRLSIPQDKSNRGGFSYKDYLKFKEINFIINSDDVTINKQKRNIRFYIFLYQEYFTEKLQKSIGLQSRFVESIFFGKVNSLDEKEVDTWRKMGILHLQAVSGSQVGAALDILLFLFVITPKKGFIKYLIIFMPLVFYGIMTDSPSVWRVIVFLIIIKIFQFLRKEKYEMLVLMLSSVFLMMINPGVIFSVSFQLSYVISAGLLLYREKLMKIVNPLIRIFISGFASMLLSWPVLLYYFQEVSLMGMFFTPLISPLIQIIIFISGILMLMPFLIEMAIPVSIFLKSLLMFLEKITFIFSSINLPVYKGVSWGLVSIILFYVVYIFWNNKIFRKKYSKVILCLFIITLTYNDCIDMLDNKRVIVNFINVAQGDCILIECKEQGLVVLIDGGANNEYLDMGEREVLPYLKRKGIKKIDIMISTHSDNDHRGGLETILKKMPVTNIWIPENRVEDYEDWLKEYGTKVKLVNENLKVSLGDTSINILNPLRNGKETDPNASSIVLVLEYGESNVLLTGDCNLEILESLVKKRLYFDIVKAPHHGSVNSYKDGIYRDLKVRSVIFSVGKNKYGHPARKIIKDLEEDDIVYYRTDRDLDLIVTLKKSRIDINGRKLAD